VQGRADWEPTVGGGIAYERIKQAIVEGRYPPGERLIEQRLADDFDLSRTPVREAIRMLEAEGLVATERNRGAIVRSLSATDLYDLYDLRARLESYAAELAAQRSKPEDITAIERALMDYDGALELVDSRQSEALREIFRHNERFHAAIVRASQHTRLQQLIARTVSVPMVYRSFQRYERAEFKRSSDFHHLILAAIVQGEAARAGRLMTEHILQGRDSLSAGGADA
jgi:DNA-binding GntR family transcriptional regulator